MPIETRYARLAKKHSLPLYKDLDREFEISSIEEEHFPLKEIRRRVDEKLDNSRSMMEEILNPESTLAGLYESSVFTEDEKHKLFTLYKQIMKLHRKAFQLYILNDDKADAEFIGEALQKWKTYKEELLEMSDRLQDFWENEREHEEQLGYFG